MEFIGKKIAIIFVVLFSFEVIISSGELTLPCLKIVRDIVQCSARIPENCEHGSELISCAEAVVKRLSMCDDENAVSIVKHFMTVYKITDIFFCENVASEDAMEQAFCFPTVKAIAPYWLLLTPGFLSAKGCQVVEPYLMQWLTRRTMTCKDLITSYMRLACPDNVSPKTRDINDIKDVYRYVAHCSEMLKDYPQCDSENGMRKSRHLRCVEMEARDQILNRDLSTIEDNIVQIAEKRDKFICSSDTMQLEIDSNRECMIDFAYNLNRHLSLQINGYLTKDGCEAMKYDDFLKWNEFKQMECPLLRDYWNNMRRDLSCGDIEESACVKTSTIIIH